MKTREAISLVTIDFPVKLRTEQHLAALDRQPSLQKFLHSRDWRIGWEAGASRVHGLPCPGCGTKTITASDAPPLSVKPGHYPAQPESLACTVDGCGYAAVPSKLLRDLVDPKELGALLKDVYPNLVPQLRVFTSVRYGKSVATDLDADLACRRALPPEHNCEVEAVRIETFDQARAAKAAAEEKELPWRKVTVSAKGELEPGWHGGPLNLTEQRRAQTRAAEARAANLKQLNSDVEAYRLERAVELGL